MTKPLSLSGVLFDATAREARVWEPFRDGIEISWIYGAGETTASAAFLRYAPGATVPAHAHDAHEHILVLEGSQTDENGTHGPGTLVVNPPGTHHSIVSEEGCMVLAIWEKPVRFL